MTTKSKNQTQRLIDQAMEDLQTCACRNCGTKYQIKFIGPDKNQNDFGIWFCPYCADLTESIPGSAIKNNAEPYKSVL